MGHSRPAGGREPLALLTATVDLTTGKVEAERTPEALIERYLGGRGLNMYYLDKLLPPSCDPLSPDNVFIVGGGLLTGTLAPGGNRLNLSALSPETGFLGDSSIGGYFGARLRSAGFDRLIIRGRSDRPCYLLVEDGTVQIHDAAGLWGLDTQRTQEQLRDEAGRYIDAICIGPAGEHLVRFACVVGGLGNVAGRSGMGAVMGSKNLKAIVARGTRPVPAPHRDALISYRREVAAYLQTSRIIKALAELGSPVLYEPSNRMGTMRTQNSTRSQFSDDLGAETFARFTTKRTACFGCVVGCRGLNAYGGEGPEYTAVGLLGANCGISDPEQIIRLSNLCNELGLDISSAGSLIPWAMELFEAGIIDRGLTGRGLQFGDPNLVRRLLEDIAARKGFGDLLAESTRALNTYGRKAAASLIAVKGLPQTDPHDCRAIKAFALGLAVASRGADHLRNRPTLEMLRLPMGLLRDLYGARVESAPTTYKTKEIAVNYCEDIFAVSDGLGICRFLCQGFNSPHLYKYEHYARLCHLAAGLELEESDLMEAGRRCVDLERLLNTRLGLTRSDDTLPERCFREPLPSGSYQGERINRRAFRAMLTRYYRLRGWDANGTVPRKRAKELRA